MYMDTLGICVYILICSSHFSFIKRRNRYIIKYISLTINHLTEKWIVIDKIQVYAT